MAEFNAYQAAVLADDVYALTKLTSLDQAMSYLKHEHGDVFELANHNVFKAKTEGMGYSSTALLLASPFRKR